MSANNKRLKHGVPEGAYHGAVIDGRMIALHPTKGWRNRSGKDQGFNLTRFLIDHFRRG